MYKSYIDAEQATALQIQDNIRMITYFILKRGLSHLFPKLLNISWQQSSLQAICVYTFQNETFGQTIFETVEKQPYFSKKSLDTH